MTSTSHSPVAGAVLERVDHRRQDLLGLVGVDRADLGEQARALRDDVGGLDPAVQVADVRRRLVVDAAVRHRDRRVGGGEDRRAALLRAQPRVRGLAVELGLHAVERRRGGDKLADRRRVVEHVAELRAQLRRVEALGAQQADLLGDGEEQLEADRRALDRAAAGDREDHRHRGLVVRAEDAGVRVLPAVVDQHGVDRRLRRHRVQVRAQQHGPLRAPADARQQVARLVALDLEPHPAQLGGDALGARRLLPRRARDAAEVREELALPGLLRLARRPQGAPGPRGGRVGRRRGGWPPRRASPGRGRLFGGELLRALSFIRSAPPRRSRGRAAPGAPGVT